MKNTHPIDFDDLTNRYHLLLQLQQTLLLSTASADGTPDISYAPFVRDPSGSFIIYVSELASHTRNLLYNPQASLMFIRPETESSNLFARERAVLSCTAEKVLRENAAYSPSLQALELQFGQIINLLSSLNDFHLFRLCPRSGRYVVGFGQAFNINLPDNTLGALLGRAPENE